MEKGLKIWQAVVGAIAVIISMVTIVIHLATSLSDAKGEIERLKSDNIDNKLGIKDLNQQLNMKYDKMNDKLTEILVALQTKENKK